MPSANCKEILISVLDWGMGHTTRCIPIIGYLQLQGHHITFAGNEWQCNFINKTFSGIKTIKLAGYNISYSTTRNRFAFSILSQVPQILKTIKTEHAWLMQHTATHHYDLIISDNRYGLWHPRIPAVIITHQLRVLTGMGKTADTVIQKLHYQYLHRFSEVWVPDVEGSENLSGILGHPSGLPKNTRYVGLLSQFSEALPAQPETGHLLVLLSGPEPQRTILSDLLWREVKNHPQPVVFVEGSNTVTKRDSIIPSHINYHLQLTRGELLPFLQQADMVICRSGYSTLMDLAALSKKAMIIPTPGQTEQEYLAKYLGAQGYFYTMQQDKANLQQIKETGSTKTPPFKNQDFHLFERILNDRLNTL